MQAKSVQCPLTGFLPSFQLHGLHQPGWQGVDSMTIDTAQLIVTQCDKARHAETVTTLEATSTSAVVPQSLCLERRRHSFRLFVWNPNQTKLFFSSTFLPPYSATSTFWIANPNNNLINCAAAGSEVSSSLQQPPLTPPAHLPHFLLSPQPLIFLQVEVCLITTLPGQINGCILLLTWESSRQRTEALAHFHYDKVPIIIILLRFQEDTLGGVDSHLSSPV